MYIITITKPTLCYSYGPAFIAIKKTDGIKTGGVAVDTIWSIQCYNMKNTVTVYIF